MTGDSAPQPLTRVLESIGAPVAVVGSVNADLTVQTPALPRPGQTVTGTPIHTRPGAKSANQAVQSALLGADVRFIGAIGGDAGGHLLLSAMEAAGVDMHACRRTSEATGTAVITVDGGGENTVVILGIPVSIEALHDDPENQARVISHLAGVVIDRAAITLGGRGSLVVAHRTATHLAALPTEVIDTTGCGDSFFGTVLAATAAGAALVDAAHLATFVAARAATRRGAKASYLDRNAISQRITAIR